MGEKFAWFFDVALIGIILICIYAGGKRGFVKTIILLLGYLIAFAGAFFVSKTISLIIYEYVLQT